MALSYKAGYSLWPGNLPPEYVISVDRLRAGLTECPAFRRPEASPVWRKCDSIFRGKLFTLSRLIDVSTGGAPRHIAAALKGHFPLIADRWQGCLDIDPDLEVAIQTAAELHSTRSLAKFRLQQGKTLAEVSKALLPLSNNLRTGTPRLPNVVTLTKNTHFALYAAIIDALGDWPDAQLPYSLLHGMPVVGVIPDTGIFKPLEAGHWQESIPAFCRRFHAATKQAGVDAQQVENQLRKQGLDTADDPIASEILGRLHDATTKEVSDRLTGKAFPITSLVDRYSTFYRIMPRFGILQPADTPTGDKLRAIDDAKRSGSNDLTKMAETIVLSSVEFFAAASTAFHRAFTSRGVKMPQLAIGLDDVLSAYRRVPNCQPGFAVFALWNPHAQAVDCHELFGLNFGLRSSVTNFFRIPRLICRFCRLFFALPLEAYIDDFLLCDIQSAAKCGQQCLAQLCRALGLPLAPAKHKAAAPSNVALGVQVDLSAVTNSDFPSVAFTPVPTACKYVIDALLLAKSSNCLRPALASRLFGKLSWITSAIGGKIGRAALQPLMQRAHRDTTHEWSEALDRMLDFLTALLQRDTAGGIPPRVVPITNRDPRPPALVYVDASYSADHSGLGIVLIDPLTGTEEYASALPPAWLLADIKKLAAWEDTTDSMPASEETRQGKTLIAQLEALAGVAALLTFGHKLQGRRVWFFQDNTFALSSFVHGYASNPCMAKLSNMFNILRMTYNLDVYAEYVPSKSNVADEPSRPRREWDLVMCMQEVVMTLPTTMEWFHPKYLLQRLANTSAT